MKIGQWDTNTIYNVDALELLKGLPDESVDLVWIDPPYGNNNGVGDLAAARAADRVRGGRQRGAIEAIANDDYDSWRVLMHAVLPEINRVLKPVGALCCCTGGGGPTTTFSALTNWLNEYLTFFHACIWDKSVKRGNGMGWRYRRNYEFVMVAHKLGGKLAWNEERGARPNVLYHAMPRNKMHENEKPVALVEEFILNHTQPGDLVVDCFCGSGTTGVAAAQNGRDWLLGDLALSHVNTAAKRLSMGVTNTMFLETAP